jgi:hypothetical protein
MQMLRLSPLESVNSLIGEGELVGFNVGPDGVIYLVAALKPLDYQTAHDGPIFAKTVPGQPQSYRVVALSGSEPLLNVIIEGEPFNIHHVQPLMDELLLVCARSHFRGPGDFERNGRIYTRDGKFVREILLGDGIQSTQTTLKGDIWTSFFDEGIFGSYGWDDPIGASGLVAWDAAGIKRYEFEPSGSICDCYALNVESEQDVWFYYYTEFRLVHLRFREIKSVWKMPLAGSDAFAISDGYVLFRGGYGDHDTYHLYSLDPTANVKLVRKIEFQDQDGAKLIANRVVGRRDALYFVSNGLIYRIDIATAMGKC